MWGQARPGWRQARPCGGVVTVFIKLKPKGGRGQVLRTCRSSLDREQSRRSLDRRRGGAGRCWRPVWRGSGCGRRRCGCVTPPCRTRTGWLRESLCAGASPTGVAGIADGGRGSAAPPLPPPAAGTRRRRRRRRRREGHSNGRRCAAGAASATATGGDACGGAGPLPAPHQRPGVGAPPPEGGPFQRTARCSWLRFRNCNGR